MDPDPLKSPHLTTFTITGKEVTGLIISNYRPTCLTCCYNRCYSSSTNSQYISCL
ncbi:hypothetical protein RhiirC2_739172 [Rhizophagus irregularis]|uniref:Uncharacterized protein n=1 Tax=Rhizophagus irregularis TaxID=588596 RepID=A0A2N1NK92_9GLOM|nr:hypothetical protein RhiirC2_739172 [Rhizophagus irregularis]